MPPVAGAVQVSAIEVAVTVGVASTGMPGNVRGIDAADDALVVVPEEFTVTTRNTYPVPLTSPVTTVGLVSAEPSVQSDQTVAALVLYCRRYSDTTGDGDAVHATEICPSPGVGVISGVEDGSVGTVNVFESEEHPATLHACTVKLYSVPGVSEDTVAFVDEPLRVDTSVPARNTLNALSAAPLLAGNGHVKVTPVEPTVDTEITGAAGTVLGVTLLETRESIEPEAL